MLIIFPHHPFHEDGTDRERCRLAANTMEAGYGTLRHTELLFRLMDPEDWQE